MVEKLSELGVAEFIPLAAERSVVLPGRKNKRDRWVRIAAESAKQSRRAGVMRVGELTPLDAFIEQFKTSRDGSVGWHFSTAKEAQPVICLAQRLRAGQSAVALVGPEGGWTADEIDRLTSAGIAPARLTPTVLRVETAAVAAAAILGSIEPPAS
jgi:16S rRNA (uracil1498-N3)-methyltransferase